MEHQLQKGMFTAPRPPEPTEVELAIIAGVELAQRDEREVDETTARLIASRLQGGRTSALSALAAWGRVDEGQLYDELADEYERQLDPQVREWINRLACYCIAKEGRGSTAEP